MGCLPPLSSCVYSDGEHVQCLPDRHLGVHGGQSNSFLNGTVASSLLHQLSAELVGFYLTYPLLTIAEREYVPILQGLCHLLQGLVCLAKLSARPHANPLVIKSLL